MKLEGKEFNMVFVRITEFYYALDIMTLSFNGEALNWPRKFASCASGQINA